MQKFMGVVALILSLAEFCMAQTCVPPFEIIDVPEVTEMAEYMRVHPSGDFVLLTLSGNSLGQVILLDLRERDSEGKVRIKVIKTPLNREAAALEPSWDLISSPNHKDGMRYYSFDDLLKNAEIAKPVFVDPDHNEFYQSIAELPSKKGERRFVTTLLSRGKSKIYSIEKTPSGKITVRQGKEFRMCHNLTDYKQIDKISIAYLQKDYAVQSIMKEFIKNGVLVEAEANNTSVAPTIYSSRYEKNYKFAHKPTDAIDLSKIKATLQTTKAIKVPLAYTEIEKLPEADEAFLAEFRKLPLPEQIEVFGELNRLKNKNALQLYRLQIAQPVINKNGTEFIGYKDSSMQVWKFDENGNCKQSETSLGATSKVNGSIPGPGKNDQYVYTVDDYNSSGQRQVVIYDKALDYSKAIQNPSESTNIGYPGLIADGRVIYKAEGADKALKLVIADPKQAPPMIKGETCIAKKSPASDRVRVTLPSKAAKP